MQILDNQVKNRHLFNPFYLFAVIWTVVVLLYSLHFSTAYPSLPIELAIFFLIVILISVFLGFIFDRLFLKNKSYIVFYEPKPLWPLLVVCWVGFLLAVIHCGYVPLLEVLRGHTEVYQEFGIKSITFISISLTIAVSCISSVYLFYGSSHKAENLIVILLCWAIFLLSYSRGLLICCFLISFIIGLSRIRMSIQTILLILFVGMFGLLFFNVTGNMRHGYGPFDSSYICEIAKFNPNYMFLSDFSWGIVYIETPLGNLIYNYVHGLTEMDPKGLFAMLLPDFFSKRIFPDYNSTLYLYIPNLTVSSMWAGAFKYGGIVGLILAYIEYASFFFIMPAITRKSKIFSIGIFGSLAAISLLSFFQNMVTYSGFSFFIVFLILYYFYKRKEEVSLPIEVMSVLCEETTPRKIEDFSSL